MSDDIGNILMFGLTKFGTCEYLMGTQGSLRLAQICSSHRQGPVILDLETTGLDPYTCDIVLVAFTLNGKEAFVFDPSTLDMTPFLKLISNFPCSNQNMKFEYKFIFHKYGVKMEVLDDTLLMHTVALCGVTQPLGGSGLGNLAKRYLGIELDKTITKSFTYEDYVLTEDHIIYAAEDVQSVYYLLPILTKMLKASGCEHIYKEIEIPLVKVLAVVELNGFKIDLDKVLDLRDEYIQDIEILNAKLKEATYNSYTTVVDKKVGRGKKAVIVPTEILVEEWLNPASHLQVKNYFIKEGIVLPTKTVMNKKKGVKETKESTDKESLSHIDHPVARLIDEHRGLSKALNTFLIPWSSSILTDPKGRYNPFTKRIHTSINQIMTTGRCSCQDPNLMAVPKLKKFRELFIADEGEVIITADYSQYESRVLAELSGETVMKDIFAKRSLYNKQLEKLLHNKGEISIPKGETDPEIIRLLKLTEDYDLHTQTTLKMFRLDKDEVDYQSEEWSLKRGKSKAINFGLAYGAKGYKISLQLKIPVKEAEGYVADYFKTYPKIEKYIEEKGNDVINSKSFSSDLRISDYDISYSESLGGRRRFYLLPSKQSDPITKKKQLEAIKREAINAAIQGTNADVTKIAMIELNKEFERLGYGKILLTVHDEIVVSAPKDKAFEVALLQQKCMEEASNRFLKEVATETKVNIDSCWSK